MPSSYLNVVRGLIPHRPTPHMPPADAHKHRCPLAPNISGMCGRNSVGLGEEAVPSLTCDAGTPCVPRGQSHLGAGLQVVWMRAGRPQITPLIHLPAFGSQAKRYLCYPRAGRTRAPKQFAETAWDLQASL